MTTLIPDYLNIDFSTLVARLKTQISNSDTFKDVNYEGANITILMELFAYIAEMNTYYLNKLAKNQFIDTADTYENVHRLSTFIGYDPKGYLASNGSVDITVKGNVLSDKIWSIETWKNLTTDNSINFITTQKIDGALTAENLSTPEIKFSNVPVKQGDILNLTYGYDDIVDYKILLPFYNYAYDNNQSDENKTIVLTIDDTPWSRIENFYDEISGWVQQDDDDNESESGDQVYRFLYDKYQQYYIEFSPFRSMPTETSVITIKIIKTLGADGNVSSGSINNYIDDDFIIDSTGNVLDISQLDEIIITNPSNTYGGKSPEVIDEIKTNSKSFVNRQFRTVTREDYKSYLETSNLVEKAVIWGEQEQNPEGGNIFDYNKIYISMLPAGDGFDDWETSMGIEEIEDVDSPIGINALPTIYKPKLFEETEFYYKENYSTSVWEFLEPLKIIGTHEYFMKPDFIWFSFKFSLRIKSNYRFADVTTDFKNKLLYYFNFKNRDFGELISYTDIINKMMDATYINSITGNTYSNTKGILNVIVREIKFFDVNGTEEWIIPHDMNNTNKNYPQLYDYEPSTEYDSWSNKISDVKLNYNQFPFLESNCILVDQIN